MFFLLSRARRAEADVSVKVFFPSTWRVFLLPYGTRASTSGTLHSITRSIINESNPHTGGCTACARIFSTSARSCCCRRGTYNVMTWRYTESCSSIRTHILTVFSFNICVHVPLCCALPHTHQLYITRSYATRCNCENVRA